MKTLRRFGLFLCFTFAMTGCQTVQQPQHTGADSRDNGSAARDGYNRSYQSESRHRHRHGERDAGNDPWQSYDRSETGEDPSGAADQELPRTDSRGSGRHHNRRAVTAAPGGFDFYVLNLSWSPEFCHGHSSAAECSQHRAFTLHGLWPQNNNGTYPEDCSEAHGPANPSQYADIYPDPTLLEHEWQTHGTCSGLLPDPFFALARRAEQSIHIPAGLSQLSQPIILTPAQIITDFTESNPTVPAGSLAISCGNNYLTAVEICLDKNLAPQRCSALPTCGANQIHVPSPQ